MKDYWLQAIRSAADDADRTQNHAAQSLGQLRDIVAKARDDGITWKEIGDTLGVSRQAAQQRFKDVQ